MRCAAAQSSCLLCSCCSNKLPLKACKQSSSASTGPHCVSAGHLASSAHWLTLYGRAGASNFGSPELTLSCTCVQVSLLRAKFSDLLSGNPAASQLDILSIDGFQVPCLGVTAHHTSCRPRCSAFSCMDKHAPPQSGCAQRTEGPKHLPAKVKPLPAAGLCMPA